VQASGDYVFTGSGPSNGSSSSTAVTDFEEGPDLIVWNDSISTEGVSTASASPSATYLVTALAEGSSTASVTTSSTLVIEGKLTIQALGDYYLKTS